MNADDETEEVAARLATLDARHLSEHAISPAEEIAARQDEMWARMRARQDEQVREERDRHEQSDE